jgi:ABC-type branched-subunit amino acid transport system ATPase component
MGDQPAIQAAGLSKRFGDIHALQDLNLTVLKSFACSSDIITAHPRGRGCWVDGASR